MDENTEHKIKEAARTLFHKKGYAATRTRDIAEAAGINLALLNYYFRSKEKLFEIIMLETLRGFMQKMAMVFNDNSSSLLKKVEIIAEEYIEMILKEPEIPLFIMSELKNNSSDFLEKLPIADMIKNSALVRQYQQAFEDGFVKEPNPLHFLMNVMGLVIFPFMGSPLIRKMGGLTEEAFQELMRERKKMIPVWIKSMFL